LAESRGEAACDFADFGAAEGQLVGAGGDVAGVGLVAAAGDLVGCCGGCEEGEESGGGGEVHVGCFRGW
jgi:hypothetical protein